MFENIDDAALFFDHLNSSHNYIKFTSETEQNNEIPFFDTLISKSPTKFSTSVYHKKTYTLLTFLVFSSFLCKSGLVKTLLDHIYKINDTENGRKKDLKKLTNTLQRNSFPHPFVERIINFQNIKQNTQTINATSTILPSQQQPNVHYFKLPYMGHFTQITEH